MTKTVEKHIKTKNREFTMEKRLLSIWSVLVFCLLLIPANYAVMTLQGPIQSKVSLGDDMQLLGYIIESTDVLGLLKFDLVCDQRQTILIKSISIKANVQKNIMETISMNQYFNGPCVVEAFIEVNGQKIDTTQSSSFTLTNELLGDIKIDKTSVQLGEEINIQGVITRPDGSRVTGSATILLKRDSVIYLQQVVPVQNGAFSFTYNTKDNPAGIYTVEIEVADAYNNKQLFVVEDFTINDAITLLIQQQKTDFLPGEEIKIAGNALAGGINIKNGLIKFAFNGQAYETEISRGKFKITLPVSTTIKSGGHTIKATAHDDFGNREEYEFAITITPIPTVITVITNTESLQPLEQLTFHPTVVDQGGDLIHADIALTLEDSGGDLVFEETMPNDAQTALILPESAVPGTWTLSVSALGIKAEKTIIVTARESEEITVENAILTIFNKGNVQIKETITIEMIAAFNPENDRTITKKIALDPGETTQIDLAVGTAPGMYKITVGEKSFVDVEITETKSSLMVPLKYIGVALGMLFALWIFFKMFKGRKREHYPVEHAKQQMQKSPWQRKHYGQERAAHRFEQNMRERAEKQRTSFHWNPGQKQKDEFAFELQKKQSLATAPSAWKREQQSSYPQKEYPVYAPEPVERRELFSENTNTDTQPAEEQKKKSLFDIFG